MRASASDNASRIKINEGQGDQGAKSSGHDKTRPQNNGNYGKGKKP